MRRYTTLNTLSPTDKERNSIQELRTIRLFSIDTDKSFKKIMYEIKSIYNNILYNYKYWYIEINKSNRLPSSESYEIHLYIPKVTIDAILRQLSNKGITYISRDEKEPYILSGEFAPKFYTLMNAYSILTVQLFDMYGENNKEVIEQSNEKIKQIFNIINNPVINVGDEMNELRVKQLIDERLKSLTTELSEELKTNSSREINELVPVLAAFVRGEVKTIVEESKVKNKLLNKVKKIINHVMSEIRRC